MEKRNDEKRSQLLVDELADILADSQRRRLLIYLATSSENRHSVTELAERVCSQTANADQSKRRVRQELDHIHLPKMADYGLVTYDVESDEVLYDEHPQMEAILDRLDSLTDSGDSEP